MTPKRRACFHAPMKILVLGGTQFVGRHIVMAALKRGHSVTTFTRGQTPDDLPAAVERLHGDRNGNLHELSQGRWDACIDVSAYIPRVARASAEALQDRVGRYVFISTVAVYSDFSRAGIDESAPLAALEDPTTEAVTGATYGALKVLCEQAVQRVYGERATILRPHIVAGSHDPTDRFTYWPERLARAQPGEVVLAPGDGQDLVQYIDARDLAAFTLRCVEADIPGVFNVAGPALAWQVFLQKVAFGAGAAPQWRWVSGDVLASEKVSDGELPLFVRRDGERGGFMNLDNARAVAAGLTWADPADTARAVLDWSASRPETARKAGLSPAREAELLAAQGLV